jgi:hypothetical protein
MNGDRGPQREQEDPGWTGNRDGGPGPDFPGPPRGRGPGRWNRGGRGDSQDAGPGEQDGQMQQQRQ